MARASRFSFALLSFLLCLGSRGRAEEPAGSAQRMGLVTAEDVNLRAGPGLSYEALAQLPKQSKVQVLEERGEWVAVPLPEEISVYVHREFLTVEGDAGVLRGLRIHVRAGPGVTHASLGLLSEPQRVEVRGREGDWVAIRPPPACRGWIHRGYLALLAKEILSTEGIDHGNP